MSLPSPLLFHAQFLPIPSPAFKISPISYHTPSPPVPSTQHTKHSILTITYTCTHNRRSVDHKVLSWDPGYSFCIQRTWRMQPRAWCDVACVCRWHATTCTASFECCSTSSQWHEEVLSWTAVGYACRPSLSERVKYKRVTMMYNCLHGKAPSYLTDCCTPMILSQTLRHGVICVLPVVVNYSSLVTISPHMVVRHFCRGSGCMELPERRTAWTIVKC